MAKDGRNDKGLDWYYRETDTADGCEGTAAQMCNITPNDEMSMQHTVTPAGAAHIPIAADTPRTRILEASIALDRSREVGPDGMDDTVHLNGIVHPGRINDHWRPQLHLVPTTHTQAVQQERGDGHPPEQTR